MLTNLFNPQTKAQKEYQRLIDREKLLIPENKILMIPQIQKIILETVPPDTIFGRFLNRYFDVACSNLTGLNIRGKIDRFCLPTHTLEEGLQRHILGIGESASLEEELAKVTIINAIKSCVPESDDITPDEYITSVLPHIKPLTVDGYYMADISLALTQTALFSDNFARHERLSVLHDEGKIVLNFWKGIERAKDYGDYFPDKKPPTGNKPDDKGGTAKITDWVGGKLGGFKPADAF